jgi:hypothetical protein
MERDLLLAFRTPDRRLYHEQLVYRVFSRSFFGFVGKVNTMNIFNACCLNMRIDVHSIRASLMPVLRAA